MSITATSLTAPITAGQLTFGVASTAAGFPPVGTQNAPNQAIQIDGEVMWLVSVPAPGVITVRMRGAEGTAASAHDVLSNVYTSANISDFGSIPPGSPTFIDPADDLPQTIGQDGAIPLPNANVIYNINKGSAAALTLAAPPLSENGTTVVITSQTPFAHVIIATLLFADGSVAGPKTTATFLNAKGATMTLLAENGLWNVQALQNVTLS